MSADIRYEKGAQLDMPYTEEAPLKYYQKVVK